jgi:hypothetical protein
MNNRDSKVLISYVHVKRNSDIFHKDDLENIKDNINFFIEHGLIDNDKYLFNFIINGHESEIDIPWYKYNNVVILNRDNEGYDFGAYNYSLENSYYETFDHFIFLNDTVRGPFIPSYIPKEITWIDMFTSKLNDKVKLTGPTESNFIQRHIQSHCFGTDIYGLNILKENGIFDAEFSGPYDKQASWTDQGKEFLDKKRKYIEKHERGMSKILLERGYTIEPFQLSHKGNEELGDINIEDKYFGTTINPLEVMFVKGNRTSSSILQKYTEWLL